MGRNECSVSHRLLRPQHSTQPKLGKKYNQSCDIFSFGIMLLECIEGKRVAELLPEGVESIMALHVKGENLSASEQAKREHPQLVALYERCCECVDAEKRPSATELRDTMVSLKEKLALVGSRAAFANTFSSPYRTTPMSYVQGETSKKSKAAAEERAGSIAKTHVS